MANLETLQSLKSALQGDNANKLRKIEMFNLTLTDPQRLFSVCSVVRKRSDAAYLNLSGDPAYKGQEIEDKWVWYNRKILFQAA